MRSEDPWGHLRRRPLSGREEAGWYLVAAVSYVAASVWQKGLLNWFIGPVWLVIVVSLGPIAVDRLRRRA